MEDRVIRGGGVQIRTWPAARDEGSDHPYSWPSMSCIQLCPDFIGAIQERWFGPPAVTMQTYFLQCRASNGLLSGMSCMGCPGTVARWGDDWALPSPHRRSCCLAWMMEYDMQLTPQAAAKWLISLTEEEWVGKERPPAPGVRLHPGGRRSRSERLSLTEEEG